MKKLLVAILICIIAIIPINLTGCSILDAAVDTALLISENEELKLQNEALKSELETFKFTTYFPDNIVDKSYDLNNVIISRDTVDIENTIFALKAEGPDTILKIDSGKYDGGSGSISNISVWANNGSTVIINDGEFIIGDDINGEANPCIYASNGSTIEINGGIFISSGSAEWLLNCKNNTDSNIIVKGGTFINFNPEEAYTDDNGSNNIVNYVADGYHVEFEIVNADTADEYYLYTVIESQSELQ